MYMHICVDCQSSIFISYGARIIINNWICLNYKGCIGKSIGPVQIYHSLVTCSQCLVTLSALVTRSAPRGWFIVFKENTKKNFEQNEPATYPWARSVSVINLANTYYVFVFYFHIRLPAQSDVAGSLFSMFFIFFFVQKWSQLDAIELDRCVWASAVLLRYSSSFHLSEPANRFPMRSIARVSPKWFVQ